MNNICSKLLLLLAVAYLFCACSCVTRTESVDLEIKRPTLPVLTNKSVNPTVCLSFILKDTISYTIDKVEFDLKGTTDVSDIVSVGLYGANEKGLIDTATVLGASVGVSNKIVFNNSIQVDSDTFNIWVGVKLKDQVDLSHFVNINNINVITSEGQPQINDAQKENPLKVGTAVRQHMQDDVHTSRIPGIATTNKGTLLAIFDARYESRRDLQGHMDIAMHRSTDNGKTWEPMQIVQDMKEWGGLPQKFNGVSDACILVDKNSDAIYVAGLWMHGLLDENGKWVQNLQNPDTQWKHRHQWNGNASQPGTDVKKTSQFLISKSTDDGLTWSEPVNITSIKRPEWWLFAPAPGQGIVLEDGTLVFPTQGRDKSGMPFSNITYSKDGGNTWTTSNPASENTTECNVVQLSNGSLMLNARDNQNRGNMEVNGRNINVTSNLGEDWTEHPTSRKALIEPTCMASLHKHFYEIDGQKVGVLLFVNPNNHAVRENITLKVSLDDGMTWPEEYWVVLDDHRGSGYSSITSINEHTVGVLYESSQADLVFQQIDLAAVLSSKESK